MKAPVIVLFLVILSVGVFYGYFYFGNDQNPSTIESREIVKPMEKYAIERLTKTKFEPSVIEIGDVLKDDSDFSSRLFYFYVGGKRVSGQINIPKGTGSPFAVIVMSRGYIEKDSYKTGDGTRRSSEEFARSGFVTLAPDFLGYGKSDSPSDYVMEERFQTFMTAATLIESLDNLNDALSAADISARIDPDKVGLWGHSNGGQITLTVLEISGKSIPTVLWAPVSKPFPYSILYYTDDIEDHGKALRKVVADFEKDYDVEKYSPGNYLDKINAPVQIHQGTADEAVPVKWSDDLARQFEEKGKSVDYFVYLGDDHNFAKGSWQTVVNRNIEFFRKNFKL